MSRCRAARCTKLWMLQLCGRLRIQRAPRLLLSQKDQNPRDRDRNNDETHYRNKDATGVQRKLRLHEDVGDRPMPGQAVADHPSIERVEVDFRRADSGRTVIIPGMEIFRAVNTDLRRVEDGTDEFAPVALRPLCARGPRGQEA